MSFVSVQVIGGDRIKAVLERVEKGMDPNLRKQLDVVAEKVKNDAKDFCPVDTGSLKASIRKEAVARPASTVWEVGVRAGGYVTNWKTARKVDYAVHVEFGTRNMALRAFLRPALRMNQQAIRNAVLEAMNDNIREAKK